MDQPKLTPTKTNLIAKWSIGLVNATKRAARLIGKTQYPSTQTD